MATTCITDKLKVLHGRTKHIYINDISIDIVGDQRDVVAPAYGMYSGAIWMIHQTIIAS